jgi:uncharacterized protein YegL
MTIPHDESPSSDAFPRALGTRTGPAPDALPYGADEVAGVEAPPHVGEAVNAVPGVLVLDTSWSMVDELGSVTTALNDFILGLRRSPLVAAQAHMAIVTFADTARTALEFCQIASPDVQVAGLTACGNGTNFRAALDETYRVLHDGLPALARARDGSRRQVMRPTIYFVSDGQPNLEAEAWPRSLARLDGERWRPNRFAFGFGDADRAVIRRIADEGCAYFADEGKTPLGVLQRILRIVLRSMVTISQAAATGGTRATPPPPEPGMIQIDAIDVGDV